MLQKGSMRTVDMKKGLIVVLTIDNDDADTPDNDDEQGETVTERQASEQRASDRAHLVDRRQQKKYPWSAQGKMQEVWTDGQQQHQLFYTEAI